MKVNATKLEYNTVNKTVYVEMFMSEKPSPLPETSSDVAELKDGYAFEVGSYMYISSTGELYMANGDGTWTLQ